MQDFKAVSVVLPSYKPDEKLFRTVNGLINAGFEDIIVVDDGGGAEYTHFFDDIRPLPQVTVLVHEVNKGKGRALKTAIEYYISNRNGMGVVTADGDGQHVPSDIKACAEKMLESGSVVLGVREFSKPDVPPRSKFGNRITSFMFLTACGLKISDTQTGLRAIPAKYLPVFVETSGERYEYETNMLLDFGKNNIPFLEVEIQTVYIDENATSHFDPIKDSIRIYKQILKYIVSSVGSFLIDIVLFFVLKLLFSSITLCTVIARIASSIFNFTFNKKLVFGSKGSTAKSLMKYYALCIPQMLISAGLVTLISSLMSADAAWLVTLIKLFIDTVLFICSYIIQKKWVFKN
ncbi:MAG: bifunctional glycosyltransferase family 2/GtrA family protein [Clostridia bacterium]|nr:bifunctional glycosyltransferase family 2/GtrA family protein [Clostridia bacterium]